MPILSSNVLVAVLASALCLGILLTGTAKGQRARMIIGDVGVAALMVAIALVADSFR